MRVDELVAQVRLQGKVSSSDGEYTAARIRQELTDCMRTVFGAHIIAARAGAWCREIEVTADGERYRFRMPYRAFAQEAVELVEGYGDYKILQDVVVFDSPPSAGLVLRHTVYLSPSLLTEEQSAGEVTAVDPDARTITVNSLPVNRVTTATIATANKLDVVHPNGWHELALVGIAGTIAGSTITFPVGTDLTDVETGDFVRAAQQTDWPCLVDDFHPTLATLTAARILRMRGYRAKATELEAQCGIIQGSAELTGDMARFVDALEPRVKDAPLVAVPHQIMLRGGRRRRNNPNMFGGF